MVSTIDNFLRPKLIRNQTKLHELFVFFSVLGGISVFGLLGLILGPVVLAFHSAYCKPSGLNWRNPSSRTEKNFAHPRAVFRNVPQTYLQIRPFCRARPLPLKHFGVPT